MAPNPFAAQLPSNSCYITAELLKESAPAKSMLIFYAPFYPEKTEPPADPSPHHPFGRDGDGEVLSSLSRGGLLFRGLAF